MMSLVLIIFLQGFLIRSSCSFEDHNIINLSNVKYSFNETFEDSTIEIVQHSDLTNTTTKMCRKCLFVNKFRIKCDKGDLIQMEIEFKKKLVIPYNISCDAQEVNASQTLEMKAISGLNNISLYWKTSFSENVRLFHVYCIHNNNEYTHFIVDRNFEKNESFYLLTNLKERSPYRICIAAVNKQWITGRFTCKMVYTDFNETGPVTNITVTTNKGITLELTWSKPQYLYDNPQGYIVNVTEGKTVCRTIIIGMMKENKNYFCSIERIKLNKKILKVQMHNLSLKSDVKIEIFPINGEKDFRKETILLNKNGCFVDCVPVGKIYSGIRSTDRDGRPCNTWKKSLYSSQEYSTSNICSSIGDSTPWCPVETSWQYCDVPVCSDNYSGIGCVLTDEVNASNSSIIVKWSHQFYKQKITGYITLLHNTDNFCQQYHIQLDHQYQSLLDLQNQVQNFFLSCTTGQVDQIISYQTTFDHLPQNRKYFVYIIPIISSTSVGEVKTISVQTNLSKPIIPQNVVSCSISVDRIELSWDNQSDSENYGRPEFYIVSIRIDNSEDYKEFKVEKAHVKLTNLTMCSQYCLSVRSGNRAGLSESSEPICLWTLAAKPETLELDDPLSEYPSRRMIKWKSVKDKSHCKRIYRLAYSIKYSKEILFILTNMLSYQLENLKQNVTYVIKVRAENKMKTVNNEINGEYSEIKEFYTGLIREPVQNLNISFSSPKWLEIHFDDPLKQENVKYKIRITQTRKNICIKVNDLVYDSYIYLTKKLISVNVLKQCGSYLLEVSPMNKYNYIKEFAKSVSTSFNYFISQQSNISIDARFIAFNSLNIRLNQHKRNTRCDILAYVIEVVNEHNSDNCVVRIVSYIDCFELRKMVEGVSKCPHVELVKLKEEDSQINAYFIETFQNRNKYRIKVWTITNEIREIASSSIFNNMSQDCFTDCYSKRRLYRGIRSADENGNKCLPWEGILPSTPSYFRSNICSSVADNKTWCKINNERKYCDVPMCSDVNDGTGCVSADIKASGNCINVKWSSVKYNHNIFGYLILLHNTNHVCQQYNIQMFSPYSLESRLHIRVKNLYLSCSTGSIHRLIYETQFYNCYPNKKYFVYIIPIVNTSFVGEVKNISISIIKSKLELMMEKTRELNEINEDRNCFQDCHTNESYSGIRQAYIEKTRCDQWRFSNNYYYYGRRKQPRYSCNIQNCSTSVVGCVNVKSINTNEVSVNISWDHSSYNSKVLGYITLLHNTDNICQNYHLHLCHECQYEYFLDIRVRNFYLSCSTGSVDQSIKFETQFDNLHQNKEYFVYIIPIVSESFVGEVKNISVKTHLSKPITPQNVVFRSRSVDYIEVSWDIQIETDKHGQSDYYIVSMKKFEWRENKESRAEKEYIKLRNLEMCSQYCVSVRSVNSAGSSELSEEICCRTLAAKPEKIELEDAISEYSTNRMIKWKSKKEANCERIYQVDYFVKHLEGSLSASTNESSIELRNLKKNVIYVVRVRAENTMETKDNENIGEYSQEKEFFTGLTKFNLTSYGDAINYENKVLNVSWGISEDMKGLMFEYIIILRNESKFCNHLVHIKCQNCEDPWKITNLNESTKELYKSLLNCTPMKIEDFNIEKTSFWYIIESDKPFSNFSIQLFGVNLYGIHQLNEGKKEISVRSNNIVAQIVITIVCIIFLSCLILFFYVKCKRRPLFLYNIFAKGKSQSPKRNTQNMVQNRDSEINGDVSKIKLSPRVSHTDKPPKPKPKQKRGAIALSAFAVYYERVKMNGNAEIIKEYKKLNAEAKSLESSLGLTTEVGKDTANSKKNRFINILPFDQNRVQMKEPGSNNDYINASYIPSVDDESKIEYIAAQGPIDGSLADFWQMIWERKIDCIVMLTKIIEDEKFKCLQYWPDSVGEYLNFGNKNEYKVILNGENEMEGYVERELVVENEETNEIRNIIQLHMNTWMDHCAPNMDYFDKMLFRFQEIINSTANSPYLIHCSAGVGRTGTLICIDRIVKELVNGCQELNIYETVLKLRNYRNFMVQRQAQYIFIHDYINHFLTKYMKIEGEDTYFNEELDQRV